MRMWRVGAIVVVGYLGCSERVTSLPETEPTPGQFPPQVSERQRTRVATSALLPFGAAPATSPSSPTEVRGRAQSTEVATTSPP